MFARFSTRHWYGSACCESPLRSTIDTVPVVVCWNIGQCLLDADGEGYNYIPRDVEWSTNGHLFIKSWMIDRIARGISRRWLLLAVRGRAGNTSADGNNQRRK